jgi:hypothetical protein
VTNLIGISGKLQSGKDTVTKIIQWLLLNQDRGTEIPFDRFDLYKEAATWKNVKFADKLKDMVCLLLGCTREQLEDPKFKEKELGEEWWYWKLKVPNYNLDRNEKITLNIMFNTETEAWEYNDKILSYNREVCETVLIKLTPRLLLQLLGTECGRQILHPNIWVNATMADYTEHSNWIISDVRFPNEVKAIKDRGGISIRVNRDTEYLKCLKDPVYFIENYIRINKEEKLELKELDKEFIRKHCKPMNEHESEIALDNAEFDYTIENDGTIEDLIEQVKEILIKEKLWKAY